MLILNCFGMKSVPGLAQQQQQKRLIEPDTNSHFLKCNFGQFTINRCGAHLCLFVQFYSFEGIFIYK